MRDFLLVLLFTYIYFIERLSDSVVAGVMAAETSTPTCTWMAPRWVTFKSLAAPPRDSRCWWCAALRCSDRQLKPRRDNSAKRRRRRRFGSFRRRNPLGRFEWQRAIHGPRHQKSARDQRDTHASVTAACSLARWSHMDESGRASSAASLPRSQSVSSAACVASASDDRSCARAAQENPANW
jgi:hypothetical protein